MSWEYKNSSKLDSALFYAKKGLFLSKKIKSQKLISDSYNSIGSVFEAKSDLDSAYFFQKKSLEIKLKINDSIGIANSHNNLGIIQDEKGNYLKSLQHYFTALKIYESQKTSFKKIPMVLVNIGIVYKKQKKYTKVLEYYQKALKIYKDNNYKIGEVITTGNIGSVLMTLKKYSSSIEYSKEARKIYADLGYQRFVPYMDVNMAIANDSLKNHSKARELFLKSIKQFKKDENNYELSHALIGLSNNYLIAKEYSLAESTLKKSLKIIQSKGFKEFELTGLKLLSKIENNLGNYKSAYQALNSYSKLKEELFEKEKTKSIFELETKYETEKKEKEIALQKEEILENQLKIKNRNFLATILGAAFLILIILSIGYFHRSQFIKKQLHKEIELKDALATIKTQNKLQEQRLSISRDLHDNIGSQLTFIISSIDNLKYVTKDANEKLKEKLTSISSFTSDTIFQLRDTIWAMNKNKISIEDLQARILSFVEKAKLATNNTIDFKFKSNITSSQKLTSIVGMNLFRVIQEAINNAIKYANATTINIYAIEQNNQITITIKDNGDGFDIKNIELGNGLKNMEKRISDINGKVLIDSQTKIGTEIRIQIKNTLNDV
ncbi:MAG: tetratricopeptide repeat-containing sensor histidine kinase [Flavobacteriaceae bacterium]